MDFLVVLNINQEVLKINPPSEHLFQPIVVTWLLRHKSVPAFQWSSLNITNNISIKFDPPKPGSLMIPRNKNSFKQCTPKHKNKGCIITMYHLCRMRIHIFHIHNIYKHHLPQPCFFYHFFPINCVLLEASCTTLLVCMPGVWRDFSEICGGWKFTTEGHVLRIF